MECNPGHYLANGNSVIYIFRSQIQGRTHLENSKFYVTIVSVTKDNYSSNCIETYYILSKQKV